MTRKILLATCALGAFSALSSGAAAQGAPAGDADGIPVLEAVIVTADKRDVNLQSAPMAISAFTADQRDLKGITSIQDIANFTPGLVYAASSDRTSMRGLTRLATSFTADSAVAIYHDDVYSPRTFLVGLSDLFVERVEIHRGPQGTLYGRNAIGGVIKTYGKRPTPEWSGELRAGIGNYDRWSLEGTWSGPITEDIAVRISGSRTKQGDGYFRNLATGTTEGGAANDWYLDASIEWTPTDVDRIWAKVSSYGWDDSSGGPGSMIGLPEVGAYDTDLRNFASSGLTFNPNFGLSPLSGFAPGTPGGAPLGQALGPVPGSVTGVPAGLTGNPALDDIRDMARSIPTRINLRDAYNVSLIYTHDFDGLDFKYVGGYSQYDFSLVTNMPGGGNSGVTSYQIPLNPAGACASGFLGPCQPLAVFPAHQLTSITEDKWTSHEVTFSGGDGGPVSWIAGAYYFWERYSNPTTVSLPDQAQIGTPGFALVALPGPPFFGFGPAVANPSRAWSYNDYTFETESYAAYGQVDWSVNDAITLTAGLRYTHDEKSGLERHRVLAFSNLLGAGDVSPSALTAENMGSALPAVDITQLAIGYGTLNTQYRGVTCLPRLAADGAYERCLGATSQAWTGTAAVQWTPTDDLLVYARYNRGYKALGFNAGFITATPYAGPEHLDDFELGLKDSIGRNFQYSLAFYEYRYHDAQVPVSVNNGTITNLIFFNIPESVSRGIEVQADWAPVANLELNFSYAFNDSEIRSGCRVVGGTPTGACFVDTLDPLAVAAGARPVAALGGSVVQSVEGNPLPQASRNRVAFNATYVWTFETGSLAVSGSYAWRDAAYAGIFERDYNRAPAWDQVDLRATWRSPDERYSVVGYVRNLFDTVGYSAAVEGSGTYNRSALVSGRNSVFELTPPRTLGVEFRYRY
jgi:iron complex outermembrane receptor protein